MAKVHESVAENTRVAVCHRLAAIHHLSDDPRGLKVVGIVNPVAQDTVGEVERIPVEEGEIIVAHQNGNEEKAAEHYRLGQQGSRGDMHERGGCAGQQESVEHHPRLGPPVLEKEHGQHHGNGKENTLLRVEEIEKHQGTDTEESHPPRVLQVGQAIDDKHGQ